MTITREFTKEQAQKIIDAADEVITALAGTNEDVHPDNSTKMCAAWDELNDHYAPPEVVRELARIALASLEAEPVGYMNRFTGRVFTLEEQPGADTDVQVYVPVYAAPQPLTTSERAELENYRSAQRVVPDEREAFNAWNNDADCPLAGLTVKQAAWLAWLKRSGIIKTFGPVTDGFEVWAKSEGLIHDSYGLRTVNPSADVAIKAWNACRAAMLQAGNSPVIPDGCCIMPMKLTAENGAKGALSGEFHVTHHIVCQSCGGEGCEDCNEEGGWDGEILIGWDIIKQIHDAAVKACSLPAAPQQEV